MTGPRACYLRPHPRKPGVWVRMWQTPQQAFEYDRYWYGLTVALHNWYDYREMVATWVYYTATGGAPLLVDSPMDDGEWN